MDPYLMVALLALFFIIVTLYMKEAGDCTRLRKENYLLKSKLRRANTKVLELAYELGEERANGSKETK